MRGMAATGDRVFTAAVIIIGNEILSGRTQDTNLRDIALSLESWGVRVVEARVVPDIEERIVTAVNEARAKYDYVLTTGGIGPTHDDITAACIAKAFGVELVEDPTIAALLRRREAPPEVMASRLRMALIPAGAGLIENTTGGPPGFSIDNVYVMAGIPHVMRAMLASLKSKLVGGAVVQSRTVAAYTSESAIAEPLRTLQAAYPTIDIGSYPFVRDGRVGTSLVARGTDVGLLEELKAKIEQMLVDVGAEPVRE
jgi:molybdenum cofactor synthesis domain-containing protein